MIEFQPGKIIPSGNMYFVYGDGGTGKTSLSKLFKGNKVSFIFDGSYNALADTTDTFVFAFDDSDAPNIQSQVDYYVDSAIGSPNFDIIILDNVTALQNWVLDNIDGRSKDGRQNYQKLQSWFRNLGMKLRKSRKTVLVTAHQIDNGASGLDGKGRFEADMNQKTFNALSAPFDVVGRIYKQDGQRFIDFDPEQGNHGKNRIDERTLIKANELAEPADKQELPTDKPHKAPKKADKTFEEQVADVANELGKRA
ncbi:AAA family ATPase [Fructobacillus tropaeoli]|uniref:Phage nucleotide-binding protein n=1 Tax=Fructobacillus tropaeoli TaxID=709323 RepID=A0A3F3HDY5_9LACO|nr:AAA family ATPase [Fructobacillus tropaeoli]GAP05030.1 phage nucleotide-binding protein [Fructobacillus tropaeoli]